MSNIKPFRRPVAQPKTKAKAKAANIAVAHYNGLPVTIHGYTVYIAELARVFNINVGTLRNRIASGWPLDAALIAEPRDSWTVNTAPALQAQEWVTKTVKDGLDQVYGDLNDD